MAASTSNTGTTGSSAPSVPASLASTIPRPSPEKLYILCAIDGPDASSNTAFADSLASELRGQGQDTIVIHLDDFRNTRTIRHVRGRHSPEGFYRDTYNYHAFLSSVLDPLQPTGSRMFRTKHTDHHRDVYLSELESPYITASSKGLIVLIEGMFLHRDGLVGYWDWSLFLFATFKATAKRMLERGGVGNGDPNSAEVKRFIGGQSIYYRESEPWRRAGWVVESSDFEARRILNKEELERLSGHIHREELRYYMENSQINWDN
jgi:uridine kinase